MKIHFSDDTGTAVAGGRRFYALNPVFWVVLGTLVLLTILSQGVPLGVFMPIGSGGDMLLLEVTGHDRLLFIVPVAGTIALWLLSGFLWRRTVLQILLSIGAFALTTFIVGLFYFLVFAQGMRH